MIPNKTKKSLLLHDTTLNRRLCNLMMSRFPARKRFNGHQSKVVVLIILLFSLFNRQRFNVYRISSDVQQRRRRSLAQPKFRLELFSVYMSGKSTVVLLITQRVFEPFRLRPFLAIFFSSKKISSSSTNRHH